MISEGKESIEADKDIVHLGLFLDRRAVYALLDVEGKFDPVRHHITSLCQNFDVIFMTPQHMSLVSFFPLLLVC